MSDPRCTFLAVGRRGEECGLPAKWEYPVLPSEVRHTADLSLHRGNKPPQVDHTAWRWIGTAR